MISSLGENTETETAGRGPGQFQFRAAFPTNATTVDITFAVHKSQFLEFMVKPELVPTNQSRRDIRK
jgi:hypothetical protein